MRLPQILVLLAHHLLFIRADHQTESLTFQVQSDELPSLSFQDWTSVLNVRPAGLASVPSAPHNSFEPASNSARKSFEDNIIVNDDLFQLPPKPVIAKLQGLVETIVNLALSPLSHLPHLPWPRHHHPKPIDLSQYTMWEVLNWTLHHPHKSGNNDHHSVPIQRLAWLVNQSEPIQKILSNPEADLTLFAPDNEALTPPHKRHHHGHGYGPGPHSLRDEPLTLTPPEDHVFWQALESDSLERGHHSSSEAYHLQEDEDKDKKKKILLHLLEMVLQYHISPGKKSLKDILDRSTLPSDLKISHHSGSPAFRIRVGGPPHFTHGITALNFFTSLGAHHDQPILTKNGVIHVVHGVPLLPPLSPLSELFLYPQPFSTLTSALQKVKLDDILLPSWDNKTVPLENDSGLDADLDVVDERVQNILSSLAVENEHRLKKQSFTVFAPTNRAFRSLGPHANAFLFSPFGIHILRYVLSYHIVPDVIFYTDHVDKTKNANVTMIGLDSNLDFLSDTKDDDRLSLFGHGDFPRSSPGHPHAFIHPKTPCDKVNVTHISLPTLLGSAKNESLTISLVKYHLPGSKELKRRVYVKQPIPPPGAKHPGKSLKPIPVVIADGVAWGGAIHVIDNLIHPPVHPDHPAHPHLQRVFSGRRGQDEV